MTQTSLVRRRRIGHCDLTFDLAQGGELVEPFVIWDLEFGISINVCLPPALCPELSAFLNPQSAIQNLKSG
jgi:hypothetical protein